MRFNKKALLVVFFIVFLTFGLIVLIIFGKFVHDSRNKPSLFGVAKSYNSYDKIEIEATCLAAKQPACGYKGGVQTDGFLTDITKWQVYRNEVFNFEIKFPGDYGKGYVVSNKCGNLIGDSLDITPYEYVDPSGAYYGGWSPSYLIAAYSNRQNFGPVDFVSCLIEEPSRYFSKIDKIIKSEDFYIGEKSVPATRITLDNLNTVIIIPVGGNVITLGFFNGTKTERKPEEIEKMLATFKFLEDKNISQSIKKFKITPALYTYGDFGKGSKAVAYTDEVARVEFRQRGLNAGNYSDSEGFLVGLGEKVATADGLIRWEMLMPSNGDCYFETICALGYNEQGIKTGESCLKELGDHEYEVRLYDDKNFDYEKECQGI